MLDKSEGLIENVLVGEGISWKVMTFLNVFVENFYIGECYYGKSSRW